MELRTFIDAYIDVNILLALSLGLWFVARRILIALGLPHAYKTQLRLLNGLFLITIFSPLLVAFAGMALSSGPSGTVSYLNISDFVTAQYLNGSFEMTPSAFEHVLGFRNRLTSGMQSLDTWLGVALVGVILSGFAIGVLRLGIGFHRLHHTISASTLWRKFGVLELRVSDTISVPFSTRGLRRRIVIVPSFILASPGDLKIALGHEFQHFRQRDLEWEIALELLKPFFFWNPVYTFWKRKFEMLRELTCDQNVMERRTIDAREYCKSLLDICESSLKPSRLFAVEVPRVTLVETRNLFLGQSSATLLRARLNSLIDGQRECRPRALFAFLFVPLLVVTIVGSMAIQRSDGWSYDRLMLSTIVNLERLAVHNGSTAESLTPNR